MIFLNWRSILLMICEVEFVLETEILVLNVFKVSFCVEINLSKLDNTVMLNSNVVGSTFATYDSVGQTKV